MKNEVKAAEIAMELGLYLKVVTSIKSFENFNSFFNIYTDCDEPCRRVVILTKDNLIEEVYDENPSEPISKDKLIDGNLWLDEYPLTKNPNAIEKENISVDRELVISLFT
ncbi:hypothetical protein SAMN02745163_00552 [Clostridium cavendishii DSM 21758]|uniref:Uncharacterized protein n=1 Tax=Clostridium cavendishii DSM 21758 TaxID=1121302 RepID=A0A1M6CU37_9CLOT|nr:hypothetical protein [Clostridium cavendishii]SHI64470.1 hypothetical protein SAMN02745163_00552 [Clostridium cavendishii DSM 21758]